MKKSLLVVIGLLFVGLVVAGLVVANSDNNNKETTDTPISRQDEQTDTDSTEQSADQVKISNFNFSPATITVKKGTKVTWTNEDNTKHTVTSEDYGPLDSELIGQGETYSFTFDEVGTFAYFCEPHPDMKGTVIVTE